jgi:hypothetical protein
MIEIPIGKALVAVKDCQCKNCVLNEENYKELCKQMNCDITRKDGQHVIFKLVDINSHYIDGTIRKPIQKDKK